MINTYVTVFINLC